jgi:pantothenate kinase-related protein Tda10
MLQPENNESPDEGRMIDRGKLIGYVMESILHGHSNSPILPKISLEDIYLMYTTQLASVTHLMVMRGATASHEISHCAIVLEYPERPKSQSFI